MFERCFGSTNHQNQDHELADYQSLQVIIQTSYQEGEVTHFTATDDLSPESTPQDEEPIDEDIENQLSAADECCDDCEDFSSCSTTTCVCGLCVCVPFCMFSGLFAGCYGSVVLNSYLAAIYGKEVMAALFTTLPFGSMFAGAGVGGYIWGNMTDRAVRWENGRKEQAKSYSVFSFFKSMCERVSPPPAQIRIEETDGYDINPSVDFDLKMMEEEKRTCCWGRP